MKKSHCLVFILCIFSLSAFSQDLSNDSDGAAVQVMIPRDVFIGDSGQIQYSFRSPVDFFAFSNPLLINNERLILNLSSNDILENPSDGLVTDSVLIRNGVNYNLCITIVPWKTGSIAFKEFNLDEVCQIDDYQTSVKNVYFKIQLSPVTILSLVEKLDVKNLRSPKPPLVLPDTNYFLWGCGILLAGLFSLLCIVIIKFPYILRKWRLFKGRLKLYRNARRTKKRLSVALKRKTDDKDFSESWQCIMRDYLEFRFGTPFHSVTARNISLRIFKITEGLADDTVQSAVEDLSLYFIRTDYIRFASGSIDSRLLPAEEHSTSFSDGEKKSLVTGTYKIISLLEKGGAEDV